jgi:hypothetical protein
VLIHKDLQAVVICCYVNQIRGSELGEGRESIGSPRASHPRRVEEGAPAMA